MFCWNCGEKNDEGAKFCLNCGENLKQIGKQPADPPVQTVIQSPAQPVIIQMAEKTKMPWWQMSLNLLFALFLGYLCALTGGYVKFSEETMESIVETVPLLEGPMAVVMTVQEFGEDAVALIPAGALPEPIAQLIPNIPNEDDAGGNDGGGGNGGGGDTDLGGEGDGDDDDGGTTTNDPVDAPCAPEFNFDWTQSDLYYNQVLIDHGPNKDFRLVSFEPLPEETTENRTLSHASALFEIEWWVLDDDKNILDNFVMDCRVEEGVYLYCADPARMFAKNKYGHATHPDYPDGYSDKGLFYAHEVRYLGEGCTSTVHGYSPQVAKYRDGVIEVMTTGTCDAFTPYTNNSFSDDNFELDLVANTITFPNFVDLYSSDLDENYLIDYTLYIEGRPDLERAHWEEYEFEKNQESECSYALPATNSGNIMSVCNLGEDEANQLAGVWSNITRFGLNSHIVKKNAPSLDCNLFTRFNGGFYGYDDEFFDWREIIKVTLTRDGEIEVNDDPDYCTFPETRVTSSYYLDETSGNSQIFRINLDLAEDDQEITDFNLLSDQGIQPDVALGDFQGSVATWNNKDNDVIFTFWIPSTHTFYENYTLTIDIEGCQNPVFAANVLVEPYPSAQSTNSDDQDSSSDDGSGLDANGCYEDDAYSTDENLCCAEEDYVEEWDSCDPPTYDPYP